MSGDSRFVSHSIPLCKRELVGQKKKKNEKDKDRSKTIQQGGRVQGSRKVIIIKRKIIFLTKRKCCVGWGNQR